jgi:signal peptidase I
VHLPIRRTASVLTTVAAAASMLLVVAAVAGPRLGLYRTAVVLSGSMRPTFSPGDLLIVTPEPVGDVRKGQVITYQIPLGDRHVESHRVVRVVQHGAHPVIETKGDANAARDPWQARLDDRTAWRLRRVVPYAGRPLLWLQSPLARWVEVAVVPGLLLVGWLISIWRPARPQVLA